MDNFAQFALDRGGSIAPLIVSPDQTNGLGLMNPSIIMLSNGEAVGIIRSTNYTFYHSERKLFQHPFGPLTYLHPENDMHLRTWNYFVRYDKDFNITKTIKIDTSEFDTYKPKWDFVGLEDARIIEWEDRIFISGVRRDTTPNGQGRMELSELEVGEDTVKEIGRWRIPPPNDPNSYCEKNWMPVLDEPFTYVKWSNPTEVVKVDITKPEATCVTTHVTNTLKLPRDPRGGSQVLPYLDGYIALTHEVDLTKSETGRKDGVYRHRFLIWDKNWNLCRASRDFAFLDGHVEFAVGMMYDTQHNIDFSVTPKVVITFGFQDNAAYVLTVTQDALTEFLNE